MTPVIQGRRRHAGQAAPLAAQRAHRYRLELVVDAYARSAPGRCLTLGRGLGEQAVARFPRGGRQPRRRLGAGPAH